MKFLSVLTGLISLAILGGGQIAHAAGQPAPSRLFEDDPTVPIADILNEWHQTHPEIPLFACICTLHECDSSEGWPFRRLAFAEVLPALGQTNREDAETQGFGCVGINPHEM
ncbi:MAG: hypothetical protein ACPGVO_20195 [Spirulinaceae cyanobacterium]